MTEPQPIDVKKRFDLDPGASAHKGVGGLIETLLRRFKVFAHIGALIPLYLIASACIGLSLAPGLTLIHKIWDATHAWSLWVRYPVVSMAAGMGFFLYGFTLMLILPVLNLLVRKQIRPWRGPYYSLQTVSWYIHNGLTYLARFTFLEFVTPTPFGTQFYRSMGMRVGKNVQLNTTHISDPLMIEIGDHVTIGGSATIIGHYGSGGLLVLAPVVIKDRAVIGLKATVFGDVTIGVGAKVLAHSVVLPGTRIPDGETWAGVPAQKIDLKAMRKAQRRQKPAA